MFSKVYPIADDHDKNSFQTGAPFYVDGPRIHEYLKELNEKSLSLYDTYTVGESFHPSDENAHAYVKESNNELDTIFNFAHLDSDNIAGKKYFKKPFDLLQFKKGLLDPQITYYKDGWNTLVLENHDNPRCVNRFSIDTKHYRYEAATMLATITYMGFGIPFIYMGQEIGMTNCRFNNLDEMNDPVSHFVYLLMRSYKIPAKLAFSFIKYGARDHARVPMQWDDSVNAGFNTGHNTWQCVNPDYKQINVKADLASQKSIYHYYQRLLELKKTNETAIYGETEEYDHENRKIIAYSRLYEGSRLFVCANFTNRTAVYELPSWVSDAKLLLSNYESVQQEGRKLTLKPYQAAVFEKEPIRKK